MASDPTPGTTLQEILAQRRRRTLLRVAAVLLLCLLAIGAWWLWLREPPAPPAPPPIVKRVTPPHERVVPAPPKPAPQPTPAPEPAPPPPPLPKLDESDSEVRGMVKALTSRRELASWLVSDDLIRRFVTSVDNIGEGKSPREQLDSMWPKQSFKTEERELVIHPAPSTYTRYDLITDVFVSIDTPATVALYRDLQPLIEEAYADLGYPDKSFDAALTSAFQELLRTPVLVGDPTLVPSVLSFDYADPELEGLSAAQKQLLRMGPTNAPQVQRKLREFAKALGIADSELPRSAVYKIKNPEEPAP